MPTRPLLDCANDALASRIENLINYIGPKIGSTTFNSLTFKKKRNNGQPILTVNTGPNFRSCVKVNCFLFTVDLVEPMKKWEAWLHQNQNIHISGGYFCHQFWQSQSFPMEIRLQLTPDNPYLTFDLIIVLCLGHRYL